MRRRAVAPDQAAASALAQMALVQLATDKHALSLVQYLRTIGYKAWIEDANGNEIEEAVLKKLNQTVSPL